MPTYNYKCENCGYEHEEMLKISERKKPETEPCSECNKLAVKQLIQSPRIVTGVNIGQYQHSDDFNSKLKEINKKYGKHSTVGDAIR